MVNILFLHNTAMWYRRPFFKKLSLIYDILFVFTNLEVSRDVYGVELHDQIKGLEGVNYKVYKKNFFGIPTGLFWELLNNDYDIIVDSLESVQALISFFIAKFRRKPVIFWSEEWGWNERKSLKIQFKNFLKRIVITYSDALIVPGTRHKNYFLSLGASSENVFIVPNVSNISINNSDYIKKEELQSHFSLHDKKILLYVGRLVKRKGVKYLVEAFAKLRKEREDVVLIIIGRGECRNELEKLSKDLNVYESTYFMGYVEDELLPAYYLLSNICIIPSITDGIGDPWVFIVNEAMYCGKPIIATDVVGSAFDMIVNNENGFIVPEKDVNSLYQSMKEILSDAKLEMNMGIQSKRIIEERYRYENMVDGFREAIRWIS